MSATYEPGELFVYESGYKDACTFWQAECQKVRDALRAVLSATIDAGEAPERASLQAEIGEHRPEEGSPLPRD